jgi:hypothetical protein
MHRTTLAALVSIASLVTLASCQSTPGGRVPRTDFMPATVSLQQVSGNADRQVFRAEGLDVTKFAAVNVLKPEMRVKLDDLKQAETLPEVLRSNLRQFIGMTMSTSTARGTLVVHAAITGARPDNPLTDLGSNQPQRGDGGYTAVEVFATDGADGPVVAAMTETIYSHKLTLGSNAAWARAERALQFSAAHFAKLLKPGLTFPEDR